MPRAPHIDLRSQRLSPANPTSMATEARLAVVTSPVTPSSWNPLSVVIKTEENDPFYSEVEEGTKGFRPPFRLQHESKTLSPPPQHPKTVPVTVIQPYPVSCTRIPEAEDLEEVIASGASSTRKSSSVEPNCTSSHTSLVSERITPETRARSHGYMVPQLITADPSYNLQVAVECHRATQQDSDGDTPLHIAISQADEIDISLIRHLIVLVSLSGLSLDIFNYVQQTPLHIAVITDNPGVTQLLLEAGANPNETDRNGLTAVHHACVNGDVACLKAIVDHSKFPVDLNARNYNGFAPLHIAVMDNNMELINALLASPRAGVEVQDAKNGWTPLFHAVINQNSAMIARLLEAGAQVNAQSYSGNTALHVATGRGYTDIVRLLMRYGADMSVKNTHRDTPAMISNDEMISCILRGSGLAAFPQHPHISVPTRRRNIPTPHPLSNVIRQVRKPAQTRNVSSGAQPISLVTHRRQDPMKVGHFHTSISPTPVTYTPESDQHSPRSPSKLIIDEQLREHSKQKMSASEPHHRVSCSEKDSAQASRRESVIVQPMTKKYLRTGLTRTDELSKNHEKMPLISQKLQSDKVVAEEDVTGKLISKSLSGTEKLTTGQLPNLSRSDEPYTETDMHTRGPSSSAMVESQTVIKSLTKSMLESNTSVPEAEPFSLADDTNVVEYRPNNEIKIQIKSESASDVRSVVRKRRNLSVLPEELCSRSEEDDEEDRRKLRKINNEHVSAGAIGERNYSDSI